MLPELLDTEKKCKRCKYDWDCSERLCHRAGNGGTEDYFTESIESVRARSDAYIAELERKLKEAKALLSQMIDAMHLSDDDEPDRGKA